MLYFYWATLYHTVLWQHYKSKMKAGRKRVTKAIAFFPVELLFTFDSMMQQSSLRNSTWRWWWWWRWRWWWRRTCPQRCQWSNYPGLLLSRDRQLQHEQRLLWAQHRRRHCCCDNNHYACDSSMIVMVLKKNDLCLSWKKHLLIRSASLPPSLGRFLLSIMRKCL